MKLYKIRPLEWMEQHFKSWVAITSVKTYEIKIAENKYRLWVHKDWCNFPLFKTLAEAKQVAENDYIRTIEKILEPIEAEPVETEPTKERRIMKKSELEGNN